jgi:hypothetical protein
MGQVQGMSDTRTYFAKVENGIVTDVRVVAYDFIVANPGRYGNPDLWIEAFLNNTGRGYCGIGWTYDADTDKFIAPQSPEM